MKRYRKREEITAASFFFHNWQVLRHFHYWHKQTNKQKIHGRSTQKQQQLQVWTPGDNTSYGQWCLCMQLTKCSPQTRQKWKQKPSLSTQILTGGQALTVLCWVHTLS